MGLPRYPSHLSNVPCPLPRRIRQVHVSIASLSVLPSPLFRRVGIRIITFEACSGFTHVTARWIAQPPMAAFVTRLRPRQLPGEIARLLPDLSTIIWVDPSSTGETRHRGALNNAGSTAFRRSPRNSWSFSTPSIYQNPPDPLSVVTQWRNSPKQYQSLSRFPVELGGSNPRKVSVNVAWQGDWRSRRNPSRLSCERDKVRPSR